MSKIKRAAKLAEEAGTKNISAVVKQVFDTTYYNYNSVLSVIVDGWSAAAHNSGGYGGWHGPIGASELPESTISRASLMRIVKRLDAEAITHDEAIELIRKRTY